MARSKTPGLEPGREERRLARKARRHAERRLAILEAASRLLGSHAGESFTVSAVAAAAAVSKPAVYYYFDSKEELIAALAAEVVSGETLALREAAVQASDAADAVVRSVRALFEHHASDLERYRIAYLLPHVLGTDDRLRRSPARVERDQLDADLARRLDADPRLELVPSGHRSLALVQAAFAAAHGLLIEACAARASGATDPVPLGEFGDVIEAILRRALSAPQPR